MYSKKNTSLAFFLLLNLIFFNVTSACGNCTTPKPPRQRPTPNPSPRTPGGQTPGGPSTSTCPRDALKLGACADLLGGLNKVVIGTPPKTPCCTLIQGLADLEAVVCLCTAIRANVLGINLNVPLSLSLLLNVCSKRVPRGFQCA